MGIKFLRDTELEVPWLLDFVMSCNKHRSLEPQLSSHRGSDCGRYYKAHFGLKPSANSVEAFHKLRCWLLGSKPSPRRYGLGKVRTEAF